MRSDRVQNENRFLFTSILLDGMVGIPSYEHMISSFGRCYPRGALYDKWFGVLGVEPPSGDMPIWGRQTTNTRSGPDTWRCVECHGWDYRGAQGAYGSGSHQTGFPDVKTLSAAISVEEIVGHLKGSKDPAHDFSAYLDDTALTQLAIFLKNGMIDDTEYINPVSLQVIVGMWPMECYITQPALSAAKMARKSFHGRRG
jgi:thiosulfate dehydrogenase